MCGGGGVEDNSDRVAEIEAREARRAREEAAAKEAENRARFEKSLKGSYKTSIDDAMSYFGSQGLDPNQFMRAITNAANTARSSVPDLATNPGSYFSGLGENVYSSEENAARSKAMRNIDSFAPTGFANELIPDTADDSVIASILGEETTEAQDYIDNLLRRGVVTPTGAAAGLKDIDRQKFSAQGVLDELGRAALATGRGSASSIATQGRTAANEMQLGSNFKPFKYQEQINQVVQDFLTGLGGNIRSKTPDDLFDFGKVYNKAGAGQGAQNTVFDPNAILGPMFVSEIDKRKKEEEDDDELFGTSAF